MSPLGWLTCPVYREAPSVPGVGHPGSLLTRAKVLADLCELLILELGPSVLVPRRSPHKYGSENAKTPISFLGSQTGCFKMSDSHTGFNQRRTGLRFPAGTDVGVLLSSFQARTSHLHVIKAEPRQRASSGEGLTATANTQQTATCSVRLEHGPARTRELPFKSSGGRRPLQAQTSRNALHKPPALTLSQPCASRLSPAPDVAPLT